jgi:hypothetical protein
MKMMAIILRIGLECKRGTVCGGISRTGGRKERVLEERIYVVYYTYISLIFIMKPPNTV